MSVSGWRVLRSKAVVIRLILLCCALAVGTWAAEHPASDEDERPTDGQKIEADTPPIIASAEAGNNEAPETPEAESPDTFIPSEDISENIAVKFPVDI